MSGVSLKYPLKPYRLSDDLEAFIHVTTFSCLRFHWHDMSHLPLQESYKPGEKLSDAELRNFNNDNNNYNNRTVPHTNTPDIYPPIVVNRSAMQASTAFPAQTAAPSMQTQPYHTPYSIQTPATYSAQTSSVHSTQTSSVYPRVYPVPASYPTQIPSQPNTATSYSSRTPSTIPGTHTTPSPFNFYAQQR